MKNSNGGIFKNVETNVTGTLEDHFHIILDQTSEQLHKMNVKILPNELMTSVAKQISNMLSLGLLKLIGYRNNELDIYTEDLPKECSND